MLLRRSLQPSEGYLILQCRCTVAGITDQPKLLLGWPPNPSPFDCASKGWDSHPYGQGWGEGQSYAIESLPADFGRLFAAAKQ